MDTSIWGWLAVLLGCFWVPEAFLALGWSTFWTAWLAEVWIWSLFAAALNLLMGSTGMISFGQAAYLGIGGYTTGLMLKKSSGVPFALALLAAPVSGALAAWLIGPLCIRLTHTYFAMLTLAFSMIVYYIAAQWYAFTGGENGLIGIPVPAWVHDKTFASVYKFVLVVTLLSLYLLWRIVHSPFGITLRAIRDNPDRASGVGINVKRYQLYAFMIAGAFSGLAGALFMLHERSVYPELALWTRSTQALLMSLVGGVSTFFGPIVGAFLLQSMDADITKDYPQLWQLFLGTLLVLILYGLPGGVLGFIQARATASPDEAPPRGHQALAAFEHKCWAFFAATLCGTTFFRLLQAPHAWRMTLLLTLAQGVIGGLACRWLLRQLRTQAPVWRLVWLAFPVLPLAVHLAARTPLSGLMIIGLWAVCIYHELWSVRRYAPAC